MPFEIDAASLTLAFILTLFAGLATAIGGLIGISPRQLTPKFLSISLGFSAGVMVYVSLVEILPKSRQALELDYTAVNADWIATSALFIGILFSALLDRVLMPISDTHAVHDPKSAQLTAPPKAKLLRVGLFAAAAIAIHNFPEGLVTFLATLQDPTVGVAIAIAVAIHNVPEGIAISVPIFEATGSRAKAFWYAFWAGIAEPLGAVLGYFLFLQFFADINAVLGTVFAFVGGIMIYIALDELLPAAQEFGEHHLALSGLFAGMAVMALSLLLLG